MTAQRTVSARGARVAFLDAGPSNERPPVVLVHALASRAAHWAAVHRELARERRTIAVDLPGHGDSDAPLDIEYTLDTFVDMVRDVLDACGIGRAVWMGNSMGGHVAMLAALRARAEQQVAGLVLVNPTGVNAGGEVGELLRRPRAVVGAARGGSFLEAAVRVLFADPASEGARMLLAEAGGEAQHPHRVARLRARMHSAGSVQDTPMDDRLADIRVPTLVVWGQEDRLLGPESFAALSKIPNARAERIVGAGHMVPLEAPDSLVRLAQTFLRHLNG